MNADELRRWLRYDPEDGLLRWVRSPNRRIKVGSIAGASAEKGRIHIRLNKRMYKAHRLAWLYQTGTWPSQLVDHINGDASDNRWVNLREASPSDNMENQRKAHSGSSTGKLGVHWCNTRKAHVARIHVKGVTKYLGEYSCAEAAHAAYLEAKRAEHAYNTL